MEQIEASIARYILNALGDGVFPYYDELPEGFKVPAVYFPETETSEKREDLDSYALTSAWFIQFFHESTRAAKNLAKKALKKIIGYRYLIPIVDTEGIFTGKKIRISRAETKKIDTGIYQLHLIWDESYEYEEVEKHPIAKVFDVSFSIKEDDNYE